MTDEKIWNVLSLGAGVQSSTLALMAAAGEITPMPDFAVFADTQAEPASVYRWLDWLESNLPYPVHRVTAGDLAVAATTPKVAEDGRKYFQTALPLHTLSHDQKPGMIRQRSCTRDYKIRPIVKAVRKLCGIKRGQKTVTVCQWIGISLDEINRAKPSREAWSQHRFPLLEKRMRRHQCLDWMQAAGFPQPPRSACYFCPFHSPAEWRRLQVEEPKAFAAAVQFERQLQETRQTSSNFTSIPYLSRHMKPLDEIDWRSDVERGQGMLWDDECEGMCGV